MMCQPLFLATRDGARGRSHLPSGTLMRGDALPCERSRSASGTYCQALFGRPRDAEWKIDPAARKQGSYAAPLAIGRLPPPPRLDSRLRGNDGLGEWPKMAFEIKPTPAVK